MGKEKKAKRMPTFAEAIMPIIAMLVILTIGKGVMGWSTEPLLILVACVAAFVAWRVGVTWDEMLEEISQKIAKGMPAILILITVGAMVGTWMAAGTIPLMIYYGVQIVNPKFLLVTAFLITAVVSVVTGTSWGSVATMGVALMGIASTLGVSLPATAGAVIAGSYFGDKISPLSDTTNLAPLAAGSKLYEHIAHMFYTTIPATIVSLIVYAIVGMNADVAAGANSEAVTTMLTQLELGSEIPEQLYQAIVDIYVYFLKFASKGVKEAAVQEMQSAQAPASQTADAKPQVQPAPVQESVPRENPNAGKTGFSVQQIMESE